MSREDDFFGDYDESSTDTENGQEDTSGPLIEESLEITEVEPVFEEPPRPVSPRPRPKAKKKVTKPKPKAAKKKTSKPFRKPAKKTKTKAPAAKKKKASRAKPKK
jgi:hypothetical protein